MGKGTRQRRGSGGHPAKVSARRRREAAGHERGGTSLRDLAGEIARSAQGLTSSLEAEMWASDLLGTFARERLDRPVADDLDAVMIFGEPLVAALISLAVPGAALAVMAISRFDDGELGELAASALESRGPVIGLPRWAAEIGAAQSVAGAVLSDPIFDDASTVLLESRGSDGETSVLGVLVDHNLGGMAKDVLVADSIAAIEATAAAHEDPTGAPIRVESLTPGAAAGLIRAAIQATDRYWDPPVDEDYWAGRALALQRVASTPEVVEPDAAPGLDDAARDALHEAFLASPWGTAFAPDSDAAFIARLIVDFRADYQGGDPLIWSPAKVELFMLDWVPRKVLTTPEMLAILPSALEAWIGFAADRRGEAVPASGFAATRATIDDCAEEMRQAGEDPAVGGPSKQFLRALKSAGVDLEDPAAVQLFIDGWNARSGVERSDAAGPSADAAGCSSGATATIFELKISLVGIRKPPVWRRLQVDSDTRLDELHRMIQAVYGWEDEHLHAWEVAGMEFGPVDMVEDLDVDDEREVSLGDVLFAAGEKLLYTYDFGDNWRHEVTVEKVLAPIQGVRYPVLVTARGAGPPEDCGGPWSFMSLKQLLADPQIDPELWESLPARLRGFDPKLLDEAVLRAALSSAVTR